MSRQPAHPWALHERIQIAELNLEHQVKAVVRSWKDALQTRFSYAVRPSTLGSALASRRVHEHPSNTDAQLPNLLKCVSETDDAYRHLGFAGIQQANKLLEVFKAAITTPIPVDRAVSKEAKALTPAPRKYLHHKRQ